MTTTPLHYSPDFGLIPVIPLRDVVIYPRLVTTLFVGRSKSVGALDVASRHNKQVLLVTQKSATQDEPSVSDLYEVGTLATILQMLKLPDGTVKVLVEGMSRARLRDLSECQECFVAYAENIAEEINGQKITALRRTVLSEFEQYVKLNKKIPPETLTSLQTIDEIAHFSYTIAAHLDTKVEDKQRVLESSNVETRLELLLQLMKGEIDIMQIERRIRGRVKR
ncbi:MAG: LON peptidase substrate-binding domain-containing protein, partial [Methylophilaceae bacterium]|nr:LON peptidase substrate-binding domain-containing protein [Methylophilaceae bacterium]